MSTHNKVNTHKVWQLSTKVECLPRRKERGRWDRAALGGGCKVRPNSVCSAARRNERDRW